MIEALNNIADKWFSWELAIFWQVAVLIAIVWVIDLSIRKWAWPQLRYALWLLVLVKLILPPTLTSPASFTAEIPILAQKAVNVRIDRPEPSPEVVEVSTLVEYDAAAARKNIRYNATDPVESVPSGTIAQPTETIPAAVTLSWKAYAFFAWLGGVVVLSAWLIVRLSGLRREHIKGDPQPDLPERFNELLDTTAGKLDLKRVPQVILTDKVCCPAVFGVLKPVLLMPAGKLKDLSRQDIEHVLLHELAHIKRGDLFVHAVHMILQIAYWFNPLLWLIRKQLQNLRELCCDATVAKILKEKTSGYRETLLETARQLLAEPVDPGLGLLGLFENSNWLVERLKWLEKKTWKNRTLRIITIFVLVFLMGACVMPMAKFNPGPADFIIKGTVTDADTNQPIAGAKVGDNAEYNDGQQSSITDSNGNYEYKTWYEEHGTIAEADGYRSQRKGFNTKLFGSKKERVIDFKLTPEKSGKPSEIEEDKTVDKKGLPDDMAGINKVFNDWFQACRDKDFKLAMTMLHPDTADKPSQHISATVNLLGMAKDKPLEIVAVIQNANKITLAAQTKGGLFVQGQRILIAANLTRHEEKWLIAAITASRAEMLKDFISHTKEKNPDAKIWLGDIDLSVPTVKKEEISPATPVKTLIDNILQRKDKALRQRSLKELQKMLSPKSTDKDIRNALITLRRCLTAKFDRNVFRPLVIAQLRSKDSQARASALACLPSLNVVASDLELIVPMAGDPSSFVRQHVGGALISIGDGEHGDKVIPALMKLLKDSDSKVIERTLRSMWGQYNSPEFDKLLIELSNDQKHRKHAIYHCLSTMRSKSPAVCRRLVKELDDPNWNNSGRAAWGLTYGVTEQAKPIVEAGLLKALPEETNDYTRRQEFKALGNIATEKSLPYLRSVIASDTETEKFKKIAQKILQKIIRSK